MGGNLSFGDDDLVFLKDYIESGKSKLKKKNLNYSVKAFKRNSYFAAYYD